MQTNTESPVMHDRRSAGRRLGLAPDRRIIALAMLAGVGLAGCDRTGNQASGGSDLPRRATVALIPLPESDPIGAVMRGGALRYERDVPSVRVEIAAPADAGLDARLHTLDQVLDRHVDAACLYLTIADGHVNGPYVRDRLARLRNRGTPIIAFGAQLASDRIAGHVGINLPDAAMLAGRELKSLAFPQRTLVLIHNDGRGSVERDAAQRLRSEAAEHADLVLLQELDGDDPAKPPRTAITDLVKLFPAVGLVVTLDPTPWLDPPLEWERELREHNRTVRFVTLASDPRLWRRLGTPAELGLAAGLIGPLDGELAYQAVQMAVELVSGERHGGAHRWVDVEVVTPANLPDFARRYSAAANGLDLSGYLPRGAATQPTTQP